MIAEAVCYLIASIVLGAWIWYKVKRSKEQYIDI